MSLYLVFCFVPPDLETEGGIWYNVLNISLSLSIAVQDSFKYSVAHIARKVK